MHFKVYDIKNKKWVTNDEIIFRHPHYSGKETKETIEFGFYNADGTVPSDHYSFLMSKGRRDADNKLVYEGDIIEFSDGDRYQIWNDTIKIINSMIDVQGDEVRHTFEEEYRIVGTMSEHRNELKDAWYKKSGIRK